MGEKQYIKIVLLGDAAVGKTSIINLYTGTGGLSKEATVGGCSKVKSMKFDGIEYDINIWDTAGSESYREIVPMYIHGAAAAIIVSDLTSKSSIDNIKYWVNFVRDNAEDAIQIVLCFNKSDLVEERVCSTSDIQEIADSYNLRFSEVSALSGEGINGLFESIISELLYSKENFIHKKVALEDTKKGCSC
ncbi:small GTP-binding protein [Histomonas meleagridis]|uniref:small GTP-binding protein n=1 Tax=Histomonas meleagridis TaxID=135588 RepID=UPI00355AC4C0|nr:small GTP-binding protein [Histomonas meleagridis]KAH0806239.1 small GTP-binding protein [Histomonas meleagridis]